MADKKSPVMMSHATYCALTAVKAELSLYAGRMLSLEETVGTLITEHEKIRVANEGKVRK